MGSNIARLMLWFMLLSSGMFISCSAFLPSSFSMYLIMVATAGWLSGDNRVCSSFGCGGCSCSVSSSSSSGGGGDNHSSSLSRCTSAWSPLLAGWLGTAGSVVVWVEVVVVVALAVLVGVVVIVLVVIVLCLLVPHHGCHCCLAGWGQQGL